ncbi:MAG: dipeptidase [Bacteroidetes bacterium]|nr:dipeptidase [Bacteroidota bacterium]
MKNCCYLILFLLIIFAGCKEDSTGNQTSEIDPVLMEKANELAHKYIITDGHVDLPYRMRVMNFRLQREYLDFAVPTGEGDFDFERAKEGGLDAPFMSIYIPSENQKTPGSSKILADTLIDMVEGVVSKYPDKFALAKTPKDVQANFEKGLISLPMGMENGAPVETDIANVAYFHQRGIRYITLTHGKDNQICDSSYDTTYTWNGLSPFGEEVVAEMNRVGIMVDISHVSDSTFYDVIKLTKSPVIASHSSCRKFTPGFERNMNDEMIKLLGENGGVIQINFGSSFLDEKVRDADDKRREEIRKWAKENNVKREDSAYQVYAREYREKNGPNYADISIVADHIDHVVKLAGVDHVGLGSDFDGVGDSLPVGLKDVSDYPNLIYELLKRGYTDEDIEKICYKNVFRVWNQVEETAQTLQAQSAG